MHGLAQQMLEIRCRRCCWHVAANMKHARFYLLPLLPTVNNGGVIEPHSSTRLHFRFPEGNLHDHYSYLPSNKHNAKARRPRGERVAKLRKEIVPHVRTFVFFFAQKIEKDPSVCLSNFNRPLRARRDCVPTVCLGGSTKIKLKAEEV